MPELPEVETVRRSLTPLVKGRLLQKAVADPSPRFAQALEAEGRTVLEVGRRGKYLILSLDADKELILHLGMTGIIQVRPLGEEILSRSHLRASWTLPDGSVLEFRDARKFGRVSLVESGSYGSLLTLSLMGPEPLEDEFTPNGFHRALLQGSMGVKALLLGQRVVAGVGNIYADEALWLAGIHPEAKHLTRKQAHALHEAIRSVLLSGIHRRGTTLRDYRTVEGQSGENQHHLRCYGRSGLPCQRCGGVLVKSVVAGRGTTHCPSCQKLPRRQKASRTRTPPSGLTPASTSGDATSLA